MASIRKATPLVEQSMRTATRTTTRRISSQPARKAMANATMVSSPSMLPPMPSASKDFKYLQNVFQRIPGVLQTPKEVNADSSEFRFPLGTLFKADSKEAGLAMKDAMAVALTEHGIAGLELSFDDPNSQFILDLVDSLNCTADSHSGNQGALWDVTYKPEGVPNLALGGDATAHSISHSLGEFAWHTDGAFETAPQRYFGFHVIHPDKMGGGVFRLLQGEELLEKLTPKNAKKLLSTELDLRVPDEFYKGSSTVRGKLLHIDENTGRVLLRFRRDILQSPASNDPEMNEAVAELAQLLDAPDSIGHSMPAWAFKENMVLLMDNARFLHSRTPIKDPRRWLRRVRFNGEPGAVAQTE